ncbi:MAG: HAMP domain-containing protein [Acidobacteria bacterium]|nr:HAMP domain-containing protein [Acidobacteriota bacterium]
MTDATEQIAEEKFDVRVGDKRSDEIGRLGAAINSPRACRVLSADKRDFWVISRPNAIRFEYFRRPRGREESQLCRGR